MVEPSATSERKIGSLRPMAENEETTGETGCMPRLLCVGELWVRQREPRQQKPKKAALARDNWLCSGGNQKDYRTRVARQSPRERSGGSRCCQSHYIG